MLNIVKQETLLTQCCLSNIFFHINDVRLHFACYLSIATCALTHSATVSHVAAALVELTFLKILTNASSSKLLAGFPYLHYKFHVTRLALYSLQIAAVRWFKSLACVHSAVLLQGFRILFHWKFALLTVTHHFPFCIKKHLFSLF